MNLRIHSSDCNIQSLSVKGAVCSYIMFLALIMLTRTATLATTSRDMYKNANKSDFRAEKNLQIRRAATSHSIMGLGSKKYSIGKTNVPVDHAEVDDMLLCRFL